MSELQEVPIHSVLRQLVAKPGRNTVIALKKKNQIAVTDTKTDETTIVRRIQLVRAVFVFAEHHKHKRFGRRAALARAIDERDWLEFLNLCDAVLLREMLDIALAGDADNAVKKGTR